MSDTQSLFYLSFSRGPQFLGAVILPALSFSEGIQMAHLLGINPGGEVMGAPWPPGVPRPTPGYLGRLLSQDDVHELDVALKARMH